MMSAIAYLTLGALLARVQERRRVKVFLVALGVAITLLVGSAASISACTGRATCWPAGASAPPGRPCAGSRRCSSSAAAGSRARTEERGAKERGAKGLASHPLPRRDLPPLPPHPGGTLDLRSKPPQDDVFGIAGIARQSWWPTRHPAAASRAASQAAISASGNRPVSRTASAAPRASSRSRAGSSRPMRQGLSAVSTTRPAAQNALSRRDVASGPAAGPKPLSRRLVGVEGGEHRGVGRVRRPPFLAPS